MRSSRMKIPRVNLNSLPWVQADAAASQFGKPGPTTLPPFPGETRSAVHLSRFLFQ
jgi:hypothetical protein